MLFVIHWHESAMDIHVFPIPIPSPTSLSTRSLWVFPVQKVWALVSCIQPGLVICFTLDNIHVSMLFSWNIPPSPSPTEAKSLFCTSVSHRDLILDPGTWWNLPYCELTFRLTPFFFFQFLPFRVGHITFNYLFGHALWHVWS